MAAIRNISFLCSAIALLFVDTFAQIQPLQDEEFRLSKSIWPENYRIEFLVILDDPLPEFESFTAPAKTWITVIAVNLTQP